jgi:hypothetical protein
MGTKLFMYEHIESCLLHYRPIVEPELSRTLYDLCARHAHSHGRRRQLHWWFGAAPANPGKGAKSDIEHPYFTPMPAVRPPSIL